MSNTSSLCISVKWVNASLATLIDISLDTFRPCLPGLSFLSSAGNLKVCDRFGCIHKLIAVLWSTSLHPTFWVVQQVLLSECDHIEHCLTDRVEGAMVSQVCVGCGCVGCLGQVLMTPVSHQLQAGLHQPNNNNDNHIMCAGHDTVQCSYNAVNFPPNPHNRHPIAHPWGQGMGCLLWS